MSGVGKFACGILVSVLALSVRAESYTWTGGDGNWTDGTKWQSSGGTTGTAPGAGDDVVLPAPTEAGVTWTITAKSSAGKSPSANNLNWKFLSGFSLIVR